MEEYGDKKKEKGWCTWISMTLIFSVFGFIGFLVATAVLQANSSAAPAYIFCDPESQYYANGTTVPVSEMLDLHVCWIPISPRWVFFSFLSIQLLGIIVMYLQTGLHGIYSADSKKSPVVHNEEITSRVTGKEKGKKVYNTVKQGGRFCCDYIDGFYIVHFIAVPAMWLIFVFMNMRGTESDMFDAMLFLFLVNFAKVIPFLDAHAKYAAVGYSVFTTFAIIELAALAWRGVQVFRTYAYDPLRRSGWMVSWWALIVLYVLMFNLFVLYILRKENVNLDKLPAALLQNARVRLVILDSLYIWLTGIVLFSFIQ